MTTTISEVGAHASAAATDRIPALKSPFDSTGRGYLTPQMIAAYGVTTFGAIKSVATYAALTALTSATGLADNAIYCTYGRTAEEDGGFGFWRYDSGSSTSANGGTILAIDGGGAGRFFRLIEPNNRHHVAWFGANGSAAHAVNTDAIQACSAAVEALGSGIVEFDGSDTYAIYGDDTDTDPLGDFDNCKGIHIARNGCTFTVARAFTGSQTVTAWVFEGCDSVTLGDCTVTCAQVDTPTDAWTRGLTWDQLLNRNTQVTLGCVTMTGGRIGLDIVRSSATVTNRTRGVYAKRLQCSGVGYPIALRNSGDDTVVENIHATDCTRPFIGYGFKNFSANIERISTGLSGESDIRIAANGTGSSLDLSDPVTEGVEVWYKSDTAPFNGIYFIVEARGTSACTLRDINIHADITMDGAGGGSQGFLQFYKRSDDSTFDSSTRGHVLEDFSIRGNGTDVPANLLLRMWDTAQGDWSVETRRNIRIEDFHVQGSGSSTLVGDWRGISGLRMENFNFPGTQSWKGTQPNTGKSNKNHLYNGAMAVAQRGTSFTSTSSANNDDVFTLDRWILLSDGNDIVDVTQSTSIVPTGSVYSMALDVETANAKFGIFQVIPNKDCIGLLGKKVTFQFKARKGGSNATAETLRFAILTWSSTADSVTSDVVSAWNAAGSNPTLVANWTRESTPVAVTLTTDWTTYAVSADIDTASAANIAVFIWCDDTDATVADLIYITDCKLEAGPDITPFVANAYEDELRACRHFYQAVTVYVPATTAQNLRAINMRSTPTIAGGGAGFDSTGTTADSLIAFQTGGATAALTLSAEL